MMYGMRLLRPDNLWFLGRRGAPRRMRARFATLVMVSGAALAWCGHCAEAAEGAAGPAAAPAPSSQPARKDPKQSAERMIEASRGRLAPVYAPLAEQIVKDFDLAGREGVGIDLGSGPGTLIVELCKRTKLHWSNADINPHFFAHFLRLADVHGVGGRVSAVRADAQHLPFRDGYADIVVSRGSYHFWADQKKAFGEIYRVLKPGAVAYIGRGFPRALPIETARRIRSRQGRGMKYDRSEKAKALRSLMADLGIRGYRIHLPAAPRGEDVNYGIWLEFRKPHKAEK